MVISYSPVYEMEETIREIKGRIIFHNGGMLRVVQKDFPADLEQVISGAILVLQNNPDTTWAKAQIAAVGDYLEHRQKNGDTVSLPQQLLSYFPHRPL